MNKVLFSFIPIITLSLCACLSTDASRTSPPRWMTEAPGNNSDYYIGISGSRTGKESKDRDTAYQKALQNLAGSIYTEVSASSELTESEDGERVRSSYESSIETSVSSNLARIETVDTYYSDDLGYWVYLRLSREEWDRLVEERADEMRALTAELFNDTFPDSLTELKVIGRAMESFSRLYSGEPIKAELFGQYGSVDALLTLRAEKLLGEMALEWENLPGEITRGRPVSLAGRVKNTASDGKASYENPGDVTLVLRDRTDREIRRFRTERDGRFSLEFTDSSEPGSADYTLTMASPFGEGPLTDTVGYRLPSVRQTALVKSYVLPVLVESSWENSDIPSRLLSFLNDLDVVETAPLTGESSRPYLLARLSFRQAPANDYGMIISYATLFLSHVTDEGEVSLWSSGEYKDGGLSVDQANQRASEKLFTRLDDRAALEKLLSQLN